MILSAFSAMCLITIVLRREIEKAFGDDLYRLPTASRDSRHRRKMSAHHAEDGTASGNGDKLRVFKFGGRPSSMYQELNDGRIRTGGWPWARQKKPQNRTDARAKDNFSFGAEEATLLDNAQRQSLLPIGRPDFNAQESGSEDSDSPLRPQDSISLDSVDEVCL